MRYYFFVPLLTISIGLYIQLKADAVQQKSFATKEDSAEVKAYFDLFWQNYRKDHESALTYAIKAEELSRKLGLSFQLADAYRVKSFSLSGMQKFEEANDELERSLEIFTLLKDEKMIADVKIEFGYLHKIQSNYEEALSSFYEALSILKEIGDRNNEARALNYIAGIYREQKQYEKALTNYNEALALVEESDNKKGISACLANIAGLYRQLGQYEKALDLNERVLILKIQLGDKLGEGRVLSNLGTLNNSMERFEEAEMYFQRALAIIEEVGEKNVLSTIILGKAEATFGKGNYKRSIEIASKLLEGDQLNKSLELSVKLQKLLFKAFGKTGDYQQALVHAMEWQILSDSLYNENMLSVTNNLEAKYQNEQKTKEIKLLASESELRNLQLIQRKNERNAIIAFAALILILAGLLFNQYRIKQKSNKELRHLDTLKSNFFANISHEFRTPLTLIKGPIERLKQNPDNQMKREDLLMIHRNTNKVLDLVNQLLELSRIDQGKLQLKPTEGDIYKCLRTSAASFNSHAAQREMDFRVEVPNEMLWAAFDRDKLEKIVYNLLSNAFKFSEDGEQVSFKVEYEEENLRIQVSDSGRGISSEKLPFIFDRFYQVETGIARDKEGSGIGLSLSKNLVELMKGTITVSSEEGKGTFFTIHFPLEKIETRHKINIQNTSEPEIIPTKLEPYELGKTDKRDLPQILLVEDNDDMRQFITSQLKQEFRVFEQANGEQGLRAAISTAPDLIITDLMMPKMDGVSLCEKLKTSIETSHIPIIMLTARAGVENKIEGLTAGADDYLTKPFNADELLARVKNLIEQRQQLREFYAKDEVKINPSRITASSLDKKFLEAVLDLLEKEHSNVNFGVPQMQQTLAMSKTQLHRKLKALTNESPGELLRNFRLKRAAQLLSLKTDTITQVAYQVGFNNLSYFAKCFKELYGTSPSSY